MWCGSVNHNSWNDDVNQHTHVAVALSPPPPPLFRLADLVTFSFSIALLLPTACPAADCVYPRVWEQLEERRQLKSADGLETTKP